MLRIIKHKIILLACGTLISVSTFAQQNLKLTYNKPAENWNEALPIGNGRLGAMIFGGAVQEHLQLNEETIWAGEPGNNVPKNTFDSIQKVRRLINESQFEKAQDLTNTTYPRTAPKDLNYGMPYQTMGDLFLDFKGHENFKNYNRTLDIEKAVSTVSYKVNGVTFKREIFSSFADNVVIIKLSSSKKGSLNFSVNASTPHKINSIFTEKNQLVINGTSGSLDNKTGKINFKTVAFPVLKGGKLTSTKNQLNISGADEVVIYVSIATNFKKYNDLSGNPDARVSEYLNKALNKKYDAELKAHIEKYQKYFKRVSLNLGTTEQAKKTTNIRIKEFGNSQDPDLVALYFQFGRYLLISSSQQGTQPANLQGIWNHQLNPAWDSKYTVNINTEMNYWPAENTNLSEMHEPLFDMIQDLSVTGQESAKEMYKARGWNMHHNTDLWRITGIVDGGFYGMWPMGGAWLTQHIWNHYLYTGDKEFLKKNYEALKGCALFYLDVLQQDPSKKYLVVSPSMSPENKYFKNVSITAGTTMDNQLVFDVFNNFINASKILNQDKNLSDEIKTALSKLPPMQIGQHAQLQEWLTDMDKTDDKHRHISHLYGLFPSGQISPLRNAELAEAAKNSMIYRGDKSTGWSMGWKVNWWARLLDGNRAFKLISDQLSPAPTDNKGESGGTYPNLLDAHPPFQIDGNFGCTSGIAEMLLQSYDGYIYLLPALPDALSNGSVKGLKARGGFEIDMDWKNSKLTKLVVKSALGGNARIRVAKNLKSKTNFISAKGENPNEYYQIDAVKTPLKSTKAELKGFVVPETEIFDFKTEKGGVYTFGAK
ncbi:glycosyl hydrolase family 95 catalytic domain-containing protein [Chryseobacterium sp. 3008163]|uniref:glycoside hydrolase family 95 protein n=1 Tax=Chryseobacterium sp. 3008163 TaxID=2478663 RepID=UPI000F0C3EB5|nr:glycoside hydrolase family 95 protein [Chryseobacterium sp. 3008163]AYN00083.1 glycoside hydrolase family 95 protein [Chryseobacterium sp. 3008163]